MADANVAIVGGGPAGSAAAIVLARAGVQTMVIEQTRFPRTKACGEYLNSGAVAMLRELGVYDELAPQSGAIEGIRLSGQGARSELRFSQTAWALPRAQLDDALLRAAIDAGAHLERARVEDVRTHNEGAELQLRDSGGARRTIHVRTLIGADGAHSIVARKCGLTASPPGEKRFAIGGHYAGFAGLQPFVEMFVEGATYFAVNPFDAARANVMVIVRESELAARKDDIDEFIRSRADWLSGRSLHFRDAYLEGKRMAIGPLAHRTRALRSGSVILAGDAAGFVDPFTGQGVYLALKSGAAAASAAIAALANGARADEALEKYAVETAAELKQRSRLAGLVRLVVRSAWLSRRAARNIARDPSRVRPLIEAVAGSAPLDQALRFTSLARLVA